MLQRQSSCVSATYYLLLQPTFIVTHLVWFLVMLGVDSGLTQLRYSMTGPSSFSVRIRDYTTRNAVQVNKNSSKPSQKEVAK